MTSSTASSGTAAKAGSPRAGRAGAARGCLACSLETTSVVLSKSGGDSRAAEARESSPSAAKAQHPACLAACAASSSSSRGRRRRGQGKSPQSSSRSPASHLAQRRWVNCAAWRRCRRPPRGAGWSTALGSLQGVVACHLPKGARKALCPSGSRSFGDMPEDWGGVSEDGFNGRPRQCQACGRDWHDSSASCWPTAWVRTIEAGCH